jgi:BlaI family penicillinase repressor
VRVVTVSKNDKTCPPAAAPVELTEAEWEIMRVVWEKQPCAAGTVQEELAPSRGWAYSTVKTTMDRMVEKGLLRVERIRNLQLFRACISEVEARRGEFRRMLKRAFNGALTPMMQFLIEHEGLSRAEASQLRELIEKAESKRAKRHHSD